MIRVTVNNRGVQAIPFSPVTSGSEGIVAYFLFSDDWAGLAKTAVFKGSGTQKEYIIHNSQCIVPVEVLAEPGDMLQVGVYGNDGHGTLIRPTVWGVVGRIEDGVISEDAGQTGSTPSWAAQVQLLCETVVGEAQFSADSAADSAEDSEAWAVGERGGEPVTSEDDTYHNNSKWHAEAAGSSAMAAADYYHEASEKARQASASAADARGFASTAVRSADSATESSLLAEGYAVGTQNGTYVGSDSPYYQNSAKYYKTAAASQALFASQRAGVASQKADEAAQTAQTFVDTTVPAAVQSVTDEGTAQIGLISAAGATQVGNVNTAGATQVAAVQAKGAEVLGSIPQDYTDLVDEVDTLNNALGYETADMVDTTLMARSTNSAVTNNGDGTYTIGTTDYGSTFFGPSDPVHFEAGTYVMNGTPCGVMNLCLYSNNNTSVATNSEATPMVFELENAGDYVLQLRITSAQKPTVNQTLTPYIKRINYTLVENVETNTANIETLAGNVNSLISEKADSLSSIKKNLTIWGMRHELSGEFTSVSLPTTGFEYLADYNIKLFTDGYNYKCLTELSEYKNVSANTYDVTPETINNALTSAVDGDTLMLVDGVYGPLSISKAVNIIAKNKGKVIFAPIEPTDFSTSGMANVYSFAKSSTPTAAFDISRLNDGIIREFISVGSTGALSTPGTFYNGSRLYVHMFEDIQPDPSDILFDNSNLASVLTINPPTNGKVYIEGIVIIGGKCNVIASDTQSTTNVTLIMVDCQLYRANTFDAVDLTGCNGFFQRCIAAYAQRDGFNYHKSSFDSSLLSNAVEIACVGHDNGNRADADHSSNNGTTMHDGGKVVRINSIYYHNAGGNVADISTGTESYNYDCVAFDSVALVENESGDFWTDTLGVMYLFGCRAIGDKTKYNLYAKSGTIHYKNTEFDTSHGEVIEIN